MFGKGDSLSRQNVYNFKYMYCTYTFAGWMEEECSALCIFVFCGAKQIHNLK